MTHSDFMYQVNIAEIDEIVTRIISYLERDDVERCNMVNKLWKRCSLSQLKERNREMSRISFNWIKANPLNLVLAGSAARWLYDNQPLEWFPNDFDLFWFGAVVPDKTNPAIIAPSQAEQYSLAYRGHFVDNRVPIVFNLQYPLLGKLQIVVAPRKFNVPKDVLDSFDITVCMVGYQKVNEPILGEYFESDPQRGKILLHRYPDEFSKKRAVERALKYRTRGFFIEETVDSKRNTWVETYQQVAENGERNKEVRSKVPLQSEKLSSRLQWWSSEG